MKLAILMLLFSCVPALADGYDTGYNAGYYGSVTEPQSEASQYGRGYGDGAYDAYQDDQSARQTSEDFENSLVQQQTNSKN